MIIQTAILSIVASILTFVPAPSAAESSSAPIVSTQINLLPLGLEDTDLLREPNCKKKLNDKKKCEKEDANNRCRAMSKSWTCTEDPDSFDHTNDGDPENGVAADGCHCAWG